MSIHKPVNRDEFRAMVLRKLGAPVIDINVSDDQVEDCIETALKYYADYHYDGSEHVYWIKQVDQADIDSRSITVPEGLFGVTEVYSINQQMFSISAANMFNGGYQMLVDMAFSTSNGSILSYYMNRTNYQFLEQMLIGQTPIRFNRHLNVVHVDFDWSRIAVGTSIVFDGYMRVDPDVATDVWADRWLMEYTLAKVKYIWGGNLSKWDGVQLPNGGTLNGSRIQDDAKDQIQALEDEMIESYSIPPRDCIA